MTASQRNQRIRDYWLPVAEWLDRQLKRGRSALYRARRMDEAGIWKREGSTIHERMTRQMRARRIQYDQVRAEIMLATDRPKYRLWSA